MEEVDPTDQKIKEFEETIASFEKLLSLNIKEQEDFSQEKERVNQDIVSLKENLDYIKTKAEIVTLTRVKRIKDNIVYKYKRLATLNDKLSVLKAAEQFLKHQITTSSINIEALLQKKNHTAKIIPFRKPDGK